MALAAGRAAEPCRGNILVLGVAVRGEREQALNRTKRIEATSTEPARIVRVEHLTQGRCPVCSGKLEAEATHSCPACDTRHHAACWRWTGGCSTYACGERWTPGPGHESAAPALPREGMPSLRDALSPPPPLAARGLIASTQDVPPSDDRNPLVLFAAEKRRADLAAIAAAHATEAPRAPAVRSTTAVRPARPKSPARRPTMPPGFRFHESPWTSRPHPMVMLLLLPMILIDPIGYIGLCIQTICGDDS
jgi:hypothetical protein